jgi:hypothetical protein
VVAMTRQAEGSGAWRGRRAVESNLEAEARIEPRPSGHHLGCGIDENLEDFLTDGILGSVAIVRNPSLSSLSAASTRSSSGLRGSVTGGSQLCVNRLDLLRVAEASRVPSGA